MLHSGDDVFDKITFYIDCVKILLKFDVAEFVSAFVFSIVIKLLLDSIVGQMHIPVGDILACEFFARGSQIALLVVVALKVSIDGAAHREASDVELSVLV